MAEIYLHDNETAWLDRIEQTVSDFIADLEDHHRENTGAEKRKEEMISSKSSRSNSGTVLY